MERRGFLAVLAAIVAGPRLLWQRRRVHTLTDAKLIHVDETTGYVTTWDVDSPIAYPGEVNMYVERLDGDRWVEVACGQVKPGRPAYAAAGNSMIRMRFEMPVMAPRG